MYLPRFLMVEGYRTVDVKHSVKDQTVELHLEVNADKPCICHRCGQLLGVQRGRYRSRIEEMPILGLKTYLVFWRRKGHCDKCNKARSERVDFIAEETPHLTQQLAWWLGRLCEISPVSRAAEFTGHDKSTLWRLDLARMQRMLQHYRIPPATHIAVDEVYARRSHDEGETRDDRFFTVITDLKTRRVIWVADSRRQEALEQFFTLIGEEACARIQVVSADQHEGYARAVRKRCPNALLVWDKFHVLKTFGEAVNETRKHLHAYALPKSTLKKMTSGRFRFLFLKRGARRTETERQHIDDVLSENKMFAELEIIKERMLTFFDEPNVEQAKETFHEIGRWIFEAGFPPLKDWWLSLRGGWETLKNYFLYPVTNALAEGVNNVIKALKRRAFGYRNMDYFKLKIMQVCGYLNSRYIKTPADLKERGVPAF